MYNCNMKILLILMRNKFKLMLICNINLLFIEKQYTVDYLNIDIISNSKNNIGLNMNRIYIKLYNCIQHTISTIIRLSYFLFYVFFIQMIVYEKKIAFLLYDIWLNRYSLCNFSSINFLSLLFNRYILMFLDIFDF